MEKLTQEERGRLQRILGELSEYQTTADALRQHLSLLSASLSELSMTLEAIKTVKELKPGTDIFVPMGSDSYITAKLGTTERVITGLGANVAAERGIGDALKVLEERGAELERALGQAREELGKLGERIETLRPEADRILGKVREERQ